jgi:hypothetical protein
MSDIAQGKIKFDEVQEVDIADLLGRDAVIPDPSLLSANITNCFTRIMLNHRYMLISSGMIDGLHIKCSANFL